MRVFRHAVFVAFVLAVTAGAPCGGRGAENEAQSAAAKKLSLPRRPAWTTSRIHGSPEPPPPYRAERIYPSLKFEQPVEMVHEAELGGPVVVERRGKMFLLSGGVASDRRQLFFGGREDVDGLTAVYGLAFHPDFADNRLCYVCYILDAELPEGTRVSRFRVTEGDSPRIDPASETILLTWRSGGHNGGCLRFGPDGYLYISTGDASPPSPPDVHDTGQNLTDFLSCILRIDVDARSDGRHYKIPADNPFTKTENAQGEIWAYGLRNPWRMSFDRQTGHLWVGDVGWQLWEMVYRIEPGGNYGWSIKEGPQDVRVESARGPTAILPPLIALPRSEAASVTGGYVYRGRRHKELVGRYIYGDYVTGKIWALSERDGSVENELLANTSTAIITFYEGPDGELAFMDYRGGTIHRLVRNDRTADDAAAFPKKLSDTGLFASTKDHTPAPGVVPFSINAPQWLDHGTAEYIVAIPGEASIRLGRPTERVPLRWGSFPPDTVLAKTIYLEMERGNPDSRRRIETQILHAISKDWRGNSGEWRGYTYVWNDDQTDATLAPAEGKEMTFHVDDAHSPGGRRKQRWRVPGRNECYTCHNPWAGYRLAFTPEQLNRQHAFGEVTANQLQAMLQRGVLDHAPPEGDSPEDKGEENAGIDVPAVEALVDPYDKRLPIDGRARSYLHVNCAHCHRFGGGGTATIDLRWDRKLEQMKAVGVRPTQGTFAIPDARIIWPGYPEHSVLAYRMATLGRGRMPHIGSQLIDVAGLRLVADWIREMEPAAADADSDKVIRKLRAQHERLIHAVGQAGNSQNRQSALKELRGSTAGALQLALHADDSLGAQLREPALAAVIAGHSDPQVRGLLERFLPEEMRTRRLGTAIDAQEILAMEGDAARGKQLFLRSEGIACRNCHRIYGDGGNLGPDLTRIGAKLKPSQLLQSITEPSRTIDPKYVTYLVETVSGRVHSGLLAENGEEEIALRTAPDELLRIARDEIAVINPQPKSMMPELLYRDLTARQLADLLAYLKSLR